MRALVLLLALAGAAFANPKAAAVHDKQAKAFFDSKQYDDAIDQFKKSYALDKKPVTLFKIAQAYYRKADFQNAIDFYQQYLQADPEGPFAQEALKFTTIAKQNLDDAKAKAKAAEDERKRIEDEKRRLADDAKKQAVVSGHIKNAEAFVNAGTWTSAGDEYMAACLAGGDATLMIDSGDAYRKQPAHDKAIAAYRAYLDRVPTGARSDEARTKLADVVREQQVAAAEVEKRRVAALEAERKDRDRDRAEPTKGPPPLERGWSSLGPRAAFGVAQGDTNPTMMSSSNGLVFKPSFEVGAFARYQLHARIALRPEAFIVYRSMGFDGQLTMSMTEDDAVIIKRGGVAAAVPIYFSLQRDGEGFRIGVGPFVAAMPVFSKKVKTGHLDPGDAELLDYGLLAGIEIDFGLISLDLRFNKGFGQLGSSFDATTYALVAGVTVGFEPAR